MTYTCNDCQQPVNRADAHLRSVNFEQIAYCHDCWTTRHAPADAVIPQPRGSADQPAGQPY